MFLVMQEVYVFSLGRTVRTEVKGSKGSKIKSDWPITTR